MEPLEFAIKVIMRQQEQIERLTDTLRDLLPVVNRVILSDTEEQAAKDANSLVEYPVKEMQK